MDCHIRSGSMIRLTNFTNIEHIILFSCFFLYDIGAPVRCYASALERSHEPCSSASGEAKGFRYTPIMLERPTIPDSKIS